MPAPRSQGSFFLTIASLNVPVRLYAAGSARPTRFQLLHDVCRTRVKQQYICPHHAEVVERGSMVRGFEVATDTVAVFTDAELAQLDAPRTGSVEVETFVPVEAVPPTRVERTWILGPNRGGDAGYALLVVALQRAGRIGIGRRWTRGREQLCALRSTGHRLLLQELYFSHELADPDVPPRIDLSEESLRLAVELVDRLGTADIPSEIQRDRYRDRIEEAARRKLSGNDVVSTVPDQPAVSGDLVAALRASLLDTEG